MKFRNTLLIAAVFLALAGYLYFVEQPRHQEEAQAKKLLQFPPDAVSEVTLTYPDRQIVLKKTAAGWRLQKPLDVAADQSAVSNLVHAVADAEVKRTLAGEAEALDVYGLDKPDVIVSLSLADGKPLPAVRVGKAAPVGFSAYAMLEGSSEVKIVPSVFQTGMKREVKDLRDKTIIDFKDEEVQAIEIVTPQSTVGLARDGAGWRIDKPRTLKADAAEVRSFLSSLRGVRAEDFVDQPAALADYGLDDPRAKVAVVAGKDQTRQELWIGAEKAKDSKNVLYVKRADADTVYAVGTWAWSGLNKDASALRDKTVLPFDLASLAAVEVTRRDGQAYRLVKEPRPAPAAPPTPAEAAAPASSAAPEATWKLDGAERSKSVQIGELIADLHGLKGYEIAAEKPADLAAYGLAEPAITFSLLDAAGKPLGRLLAGQVGGEADAEAYAMSEGGEVVYRLRGYLYGHVDKKKEDLVEASAAPTPTPAQ